MEGMKSQTRKDRLKILVSGEPSTASFARKYGLDPTYISQMLNGHRNIGEKTARKIEELTGRPTGWLDGESGEKWRDTSLLASFNRLSEPNKTAIEMTIQAMLKAENPNG